MPVAVSRGTCSLAMEGPLARARSRTRKLQHGHVAAYFTPVAPKSTCNLFAHGRIWNRVDDVGCLETDRCMLARPLSMNPAGAFQVMEAIGDVLLCPRAIISFACYKLSCAVVGAFMSLNFAMKEGVPWCTPGSTTWMGNRG